MSDPINPKHYNRFTDHEPIAVIEEWVLNYNLGNVVKYISRAGYKDGSSRLTDLKKAQWYLDREITKEANEPQRNDSDTRITYDSYCIECGYFPDYCKCKHPGEV